MEEYDYTERRKQLRRIRRTPRQKPQSYFILKVNTALAFGIIILCANMIDLDVTNAFSDMMKKMITQSTDMNGLKATVTNAVSSFYGQGISVFAKERKTVVMSDELVEKMNAEAEAYAETQKKTQPLN